eukprot:11366115-Heterocapsa_arctica.AAC.1
MVIQAELGLCRGIYKMIPPPVGKSEEISFELAHTVNAAGQTTGAYYLVVDAGANYGRTIGQLGYVVNIDALLRANVR